MRITISSDQIQSPSIALGDSIEMNALSCVQMTVMEASLPRQRVESTSPMYSSQGDVSLDLEVLCALEGRAIFEFVHLLPITADLETLVQNTNSQIEFLSFLEWNRFPLLLAPASVRL